MNMETNDALAGADDDALLNEVMNSGPEKADTFQPVEPVAEQPAQAAPEAQPVQDREPVRVPLHELMEERKQRQALERQMQDLIATMRANQPAPAPVPQPDIWDDPANFVRAQVRPDMERQHQATMYNARLIAEARFGEAVVKEAQETFDNLLSAGNLHPADHSKIMGSPNPFAEAVKWYQAHKIVSEIGTDPTAYKAKLKSDLLNDPEFRKEMMATLQQQANGSPASRQSPPIALPSLSKVGATALPSGDGVPSDAELWASVTSAKRR